MKQRLEEAGLTLVEVLLGVLTLTIVLSAILGAYLGQVTLNEHARNLSFAVQDADRVVEELRRRNEPCAGTEPSAVSPEGVPPQWDVWLAGGGGSKSLQWLGANSELIMVTCRDATTGDSCGPNQVGTGEWKFAGGPTSFNSIEVTVAVCWRHRNRVVGECSWAGATLQAADRPAGPVGVVGVIESPAMLTTLVTCH